MAGSKDRLMNFRVRLDMDPGSIAKVEAELEKLRNKQSLAQSGKYGNNRPIGDDAKQANLVAAIELRIKQLVEERLNLERAEQAMLREKITAGKAVILNDTAEVANRRANIRLLEQELALRRKMSQGGASSTWNPHISKAMSAAGGLSAITSAGSLTPEQLRRAQALWSQYASTVKKQDEALFQQINNSLKRFAEINKRKIAEEKHTNDAIKKMWQDRLKAEQIVAKQIEAERKQEERNQRAQNRRVEQEQTRHNRAMGGRGGGLLDFGRNQLGRGVLSSFAGMGGVNLYGAGLAGLGAVGVKGSMAAYTEVFQLKNILSGIIQTFGQFKDQLGQNETPGNNFARSQGYSNYLYQRLRKTAIDSPLTLKELSEVYTTGTPYLARRGVNFEQSIGISNTIASLGKSSGLHVQQIQDDIRNIFSGVLKNAQTFQMAGFTSDDMKKLGSLKGDDFIKFFNSKFQGFQTSMKEFAGSFIAQWDNLIDSLYQTGAVLGEKIAPAIISFAKTVQGTLADAMADGTLERFGEQMQQAMQVLTGALSGIVTTVGSVGQGLLSVMTSIINSANDLFSRDDNKGPNMVIENIKRGIEDFFGQDRKWGPEITHKLKALRMDDIGNDPVNTGSGKLQYAKKTAAVLSAIETLQNSRNPGQLIRNYSTIQELGSSMDRRFGLVNEYEKLSTSMTSGTPGHYDKKTGKWVEPNAPEIARARPRMQQILAELIRSGDLAAGSTSLVPDHLRAEWISTWDQESKRIFEQTPPRELSGLGLALDAIKYGGINQGLIGPRKSQYDLNGLQRAGANLSADPYLNSLKVKLQSSLAPTMIVTPDVVKTKSGATINRNKVAKDLSAFIKESSAADVEIRKIKARMDANPQTSFALLGQYEADARLLANQEGRKALAESKLAQAQAAPDTFSYGIKGFTGTAKINGLEPHVAYAKQTIKSMFGLNDVGGFRTSARDMKGHPAGLALDPMVGKDKAKGDAIVEWSMANAKQLGMDYIIWQQQISHYRNGKWTGWKKMGDRGSGTQNHMDHPHLQYRSGVGVKAPLTTAQISKGAKGVGNYTESVTDIQADLALRLQKTTESKLRLAEELASLDADLTAARLELTGNSITDPRKRYENALQVLQSKNATSRANVTGLGYLALMIKNPAEAKRRMLAYLQGKSAEQQLTLEEKERIKTYDADWAAEKTSINQANWKKGLDNIRFNESLTSMSPLERKSALLEKKITEAESGDGLAGAFAKILLPALYEQRRALEQQRKALEDNTAELQRNRDDVIEKRTSSIFESGIMSPTQRYRQRFDKRMTAIDNLSPTRLNQIRASMGMAGMAMSNDDLRHMLKANAFQGFDRQGQIRAMYQDQALGGSEAALQAILRGEDPITALGGSFENITGNEAISRLLGSMFNKGSYRQSVMNPDGTTSTRFNKGAFTNDLISGGGSFAAQYIVKQALPQNSYANEGSQIGGMLAGLGLGAQLGAWAGPVGMIAGGLIGSLFGKKKGPDPMLEQHQKRLEELLQTISNRLKPQEDFYRTIKGTALFGADSRSFSGRSSVIGVRAALGAI